MFFSFLFFFFSLRLHAPFFTGAFPLYSLVLFNPSLPLVDNVSDLLDACPIRTLLEALGVVVRLNILVLALFPHKCGQGIRCRTFNVVVAAFFSDIS